MGASASSLSYAPVTSHLPLATIDACKLPMSVDLRTHKLLNIVRRKRVHSSVYAVLASLVIECERNGSMFVLPSIASISHVIAPDGCVNPAIVVNTLNMGISPESDSNDESDNEMLPDLHHSFPFLALQRIECEVEIIQRWLSTGRPVICAIRVSDDTLDEGKWCSSRQNAATICCCITGYTTFSAEFLLYETTFAKKRQLFVPFSDFRTHAIESFILDTPPRDVDDPLFIS